MMVDKMREKSVNFRRKKRQEFDGDSGGAIGKSMGGNIHTFGTDPFYKHKIEFPFEYYLDKILLLRNIL